MQHYNFKSADVISMTPRHPDKEALRNKFLDEHTHSDFEVRFFVDGQGLFFIHAGDRVHAILCTRQYSPLVRHGTGAASQVHPLVHHAGRLGGQLHGKSHRQTVSQA